MANCNGSIDKPTDNGCSSNNNRTISTTNCSCTPCNAPIIVNNGDVANRVLIPVLADVIQNCININKYETAYPDNWVFETNIPERSGACGKISITNISYSYDCIGVDSQFINGFVGSKAICLSSDQPACFCEDKSMSKPCGKPNSKHPDKLFNEFKGSVKTDSCCCNNEQQAYDLTKIVEKDVKFAICNLNVTIQGTIGGTRFVANLVGTKDDHHPKKPPYLMFDPLSNPTPISDLGLPNNINIAGRLCLPTNTKLKISEQFDNCLIIDCIRPLNTTFQPQNPPHGSKAVLASETNELDNEAIEVGEVNEVDSLGYGGGRPSPSNGFIKFVASADLSLIINKQIYATTTESVALLTNSNSQVVCTDAASTQPSCPTINPCAN